MKTLFVFFDNSEISLSDNHCFTIGNAAHIAMWEMYRHFKSFPSVEQRIEWLRENYPSSEVCS